MKNSLVIYYDILEQLEDFTDEQFGHLLRAVIKYDMTGNLPILTHELGFAFKFLKPILDKNKEDYLRICERNRVNGLKGGRPRNPSGFEENPNNPSGFTKTQENPDKPKKADNDNVNDNDIDNENDIYVSKKERKENIYYLDDTHAHMHESYDDIFNDFCVSTELKIKFIEFIKHCQLNGKKITNDKLKNIIIRLDRSYSQDLDKIRSLNKAINGGYFDIQEGR